MAVDPETRARRRSEAFLRDMDNYRVEDRGYTSACWTWLGRILNRYPVIMCEGTIYVHRAYYEHAVGPIPEGLTIDHLCCVPACVNPAHMEPVTRAENTRRGNEKRGFGIGISAYHPDYHRAYRSHKMATDPTWLERRRANERAGAARRRLQRKGVGA